MSKLDGLKPEKVFHFFEEITRIPHGSYNLEMIRDYLIRFAEERGIEYIADDHGNVVYKKPATAGYEDQPGIVLQGHMDMVAVCEDGYGIDMKTMPLDVFAENGLVGARHTSLGGDNGIAVAMALAILDSDDISHPDLEIIITANEETGMEGASGFDISCIKGRRLLNLDSEDEGIFTVGCAGGARVVCYLPADNSAPRGDDICTIEVRISGLLGGHSGQMIHLGRGNASKLMGRILSSASPASPSAVINSITGGVADNAIATDCVANISLPAQDLNGFTEAILAEADKVKAEYSVKDPGFTLTVSGDAARAQDIAISLKYASAFINALPYGVIAMSSEAEGLVETSLNLGILKIDDNRIHAEFAVRSSINSARDALVKRLIDLTEGFGGTNKVTGVYPGWKYLSDSPLRDKMIKVFREMYGKDPKIEAIHAGLECGWFASKADDFDIVSLGPDMQDIHSVNERLSISSTESVYSYLLALLATKD
ncbi:MAG: aminoacyl-histidine dipeptidase [Lachnospiraceae bacterium]|nr:aminoacyl-histidine dipeptidase [Lachnospiraceae bacterium]